MMRRLAGGAGIAAAVGTIGGFLGDLFWGFDLLASFRLQYLLIGLVVGVVFVATGHRLFSAVMIVLVVVNAVLIAPLYLSNPAPHGPGDLFTIVSYNVQLMNPSDKIDWILSTDADIVLLFESSRPAEEALRNADLPYEIVSGIEDDRFFGPTVLIQPGMTAERLETSRDSGGAMRLQIQLDGEPVALYALHPPSPVNAQRTAARNSFLERFGTAIAAETMPVIVAGDLNATPWTSGFRDLVEPAQLVNSQEGFGYGSSWPARLWPALGIPLDHVLFTDDLTIVEREMGPSLGSDHRPVIATVAFRQ